MSDADNLTEKVANAMAHAVANHTDPLADADAVRARAAIAVVVAEAAKVAKNHAPPRQEDEGDYESGVRRTANAIEAAIRALATPDAQSPPPVS